MYGLFLLSLQSEHIYCGSMFSKSVFLIALALSQFSIVKYNLLTSHMNGSWLPCLILIQSPHGLPKQISNKYTDAPGNPLHTPRMLAHVIACEKIFLI